MKSLMKCAALTGLCAVGVLVSAAQDSVDVTFRYTNASASGVSLPGEFNGWNNSVWPMTSQGGGLWTRTARLALGGDPAPTVHGAWQYKFFPAGTSGAWPNDPLNHHVNATDNDNSFVYTKDPTFYQTLPNQRLPVQTTSTPTITSFIFPKVGASVDTSSIELVIDSVTIAGIGAYFNAATQQLSYPLALPLANGGHTMIIRASSSAGGSNSDTVTFYTQGGYVQISNRGGYTTLTSQRTLYGSVQGSGVTSVAIVRNNTDTVSAPVSSGKFSATVPLLEGLNTFRALADSSGTQVSSSPVSFTHFVNHSPTALITFMDLTSSIQLQATGSTDPDSGQSATLTFLWGEDPGNPSHIGGINGTTTPTISIARPQVQGEYYFSLVATDADGHRDTTRSFFTAGPTPPIVGASYTTIPQWVREGRMYLMFFKSHTASGTINAAYPDLDRIAAMGYNIIWVMPVMKNASPINNGPGPGYDIVDFMTVAPEYGTNQDMQNFIARAHQLGMKVILDITPNHTSSMHPFVLDARMFGTASEYWTYYQHQIIPYTGPGLGELSQSVTGDGFVYYGGFSDALLNYNWADIDARHYMIGVYKYWVSSIGADGYRLDVYWGPHTRANSPNGGEGEMGQPVRQALKHIRPDIDLLGEASGTGVGTEVLYADQGGGVDEAYDWNLKGYVQSNIWALAPAARVNGLDAALRNGSVSQGMGYVPGLNSSFLRFLENQDEDRIAYVYSAGSVDAATARARTMPVATAVNLAVGLPEVYSGQEIGRGPGISDFDSRRRGVLNFSDPAGQILMPHYQKLAQIRKQFSCFTTQSMVRVSVDAQGVYAYTRPMPGLNGVVLANIDGAAHNANVILTISGTPAPLVGLADGRQYVATDLYNNNAQQALAFTGGVDTLKVTLPAYGSAVFVIDTVSHTLVLPSLTGIASSTAPVLPQEFVLAQNYPNPFNPSTTISYQLSRSSLVSLKVFDVLGREVATLVEASQPAGTYTTTFNASRLSSGVYFYRLRAGSFVSVKKMILAK